MNNINHLGLDGYSLRTFLTVLEEGSVTKAATRLGVTQSAVSHTLEKLRTAFDDPLFIREGRGIRPTIKALSLKEQVEAILANLKSLTNHRAFDPMLDPIEFTIATNDFPLGFIFPTLLKDLYAEGIRPRLHFIPAGIPSANISRTSDCQMLITPALPKKDDLCYTPLIESYMVCFYDAEVRKSPATLQEYVDSDYLDVRFSGTESSQMVLPPSLLSKLEPATITVPNFNAASAFIKGTNLITTQLSAMAYGSLKDLDWAPLPVDTELRPLYLVWHKSDDEDLAHRWLRQRIASTVQSIVNTK